MKVIGGISGIALVIWSLPICFRVHENYVRHSLVIVLGVVGFVVGLYLIWKCIKNKEGEGECT